MIKGLLKMAPRHQNRYSFCKSIHTNLPLNIHILITQNSDIDNCLYPKSKCSLLMSELVF